jgi:hypothetical protein
MAAPVKRALSIEWHWPAEVVTFAEDRQIRAVLEPMRRATLRFLPNADAIKVYLEDDPDIAGRRYIVFHVQVAGVRFPKSQEILQAWLDDLPQGFPVLLDDLFHLRLDLQP